MANIEILSPGVAGFEKAPASGGENLSPAKMGVVGWTTKGPTHLATEVKSVGDFTRIFGDTTALGLTPIMIRAFFNTGGERAVVVRVAASDAVAAATAIDIPAKFTVTAKGEGAWGNTIQIIIQGNRNFVTRTTNANLTRTAAWTKFDVVVLTPSDVDATVNVARETFEAVQMSSATAAGYFTDTINDSSNGSTIITTTTGVGGAPTALVKADVTNEVVGTGDASEKEFTKTLASTPVFDSTFRLRCDGTAIGPEAVSGLTGAGAVVTHSGTLADPAIKPGTFVWTYTSGTARTITDAGAGVLAGDGSGTINYDTGAYTLTTSLVMTAASVATVAYTPTLLVTDNGDGGLIGDIDATGTNTINYTTGAISVKFATAPIAASNNIKADYCKLATSTTQTLATGADGTAVARNDISAVALEATNKGIYALDKFEQPLNVVVPDFDGSSTVAGDLITWAEARANNPYHFGRFLILGFANGTTPGGARTYAQVTLASSSNTNVAAIYYNNVKFRRDDGVLQTVPCSGFVAGAFSKTAQQKNVGRTPAGIGVGNIDGPGVVGPEFTLTRANQDLLYQGRINPLVKNDATGFMINGGRTMSTIDRWKYVNARTLNDHLFFRVNRVLQFAVFENNGPSLWSRAQAAVDGMMSTFFQLGYFGGSVASEAYFVRCDSSNNTRTSNTLNVDVGFTPGIPAEFVVFTVQQPVNTATS